jgi:hypothetical protein
MEISSFKRDEDQDEINPMEWLRMVKESRMSSFGEDFYIFGGSSKWWKSLNEDTRLHITWESLEELFSNKWIRDTKLEAMYKIQDELK